MNRILRLSALLAIVNLMLDILSYAEKAKKSNEAQLVLMRHYIGLNLKQAQHILDRFMAVKLNNHYCFV